MSYATWIKAVDLERWPDELQGRQKLPALVRRLVHATVESPTLVQFPADEGIQRKGLDGLVQVDQGNAWVPNGTSAWEIGTDKEPQAKANKEYAKRTLAPGSIDPTTTTFVFVTPRKWEGKGKWQEEKRKEGKWRDVLVYDSDNLEQWIELAPAVDAWLARLLGKVSLGVRDLSSFWDAIAATSEPPLRQEIFFAGRTKAKEDFERALAGPAKEIAVHALSLNELRDFLAAVISSEGAETADAASARVLIVETRDAWRQLTATKLRLTLIASDQLTPDRTMIAEAIAGGHRVVTQLPYTPLRDVPEIRLPRAFRWELQAALEDAGFGRERSHRLAREAGGCTSVLVRIASRFEGQHTPAWSVPTEAGPLLPLVLLGSWNDKNRNDRLLIEKFTGKSYAEIQTLATRWLNQVDAPLQFVDGIYSFVSREDSWRLLSPLISSDQIEFFEKEALAVLGEHDPRFEMPSNTRYLAALSNKLPVISQHVREGIAETVALLGARGEHTPHGSSVGSSSRAASIVRGLLNGAAAERWFSLSRLLPLLAEGAPDEFLMAVEDDLASSDPAIAALFSDESPAFYASSPHVGLMWALQNLAWDSSQITQVSLALARLTELDLGGRNHPRPSGVLHGIYRFWHPETSATIDERLEVLDLVTSRYPDLAWSLLKLLVPQGNDSASSGSKPRWREYDEPQNDAITYSDIFRQVNWAADKLIKLAAEDPSKWEDLAENFVQLPDALRDAFIAWFGKADTAPLDSNKKVQMWKIVRNLVQKHRFYHDAFWALPPEKVDELAAIEVKLVPNDPLLKHEWLFGNGVHDAVGDMETPWGEREKMIEEVQSTALKEIFSIHGLDGIIKFLAVTSSPQLIGVLIAKLGLVPNWQEILPRGLAETNTNLCWFALGYAGTRLASEGDVFLGSLPLESWAPENVAEFALAMRFDRSSWEIIRKRHPLAEPIYWKRVRPFVSQMADDELEEAIRCLLQYDRSDTAIDALSSAIRNARRPDWNLVADVLEAASITFGTNTVGRNYQHDIWQIGAVMKYLQSVPPIDPVRLTGLEWLLLPLARYHGFSPKSLHRELAANPAFFLEVTMALFMPDGEQRQEHRAPDQAEMRVADAAYQLLDSWVSIPGTMPDGTIDSSVLMKWVEETRQLCAENKRLDGCDAEIGQVLAYSPIGADDAWPCEAVRAVLERTASEKLHRGFITAIYNKRGVVTKSLTEGGEQERELSAKYKAWALKCKIRWPKTARTLRQIADHYESYAKHEDERIEARD